MAEQVETAGLEAKAVELIDQLTEGLKGVAPQMADVTLAAVRLQGIVDLLWALTQVCVGIGVVYTGYRLARWCLPKAKDSEVHEIGTGVSAMGAFAATIVTLLNLASLFSATMWAAIIDPRLAVALRVINRLM